MSTKLEVKDKAIRAKHHWSHFLSTSSVPAKPPAKEDSELVGKVVKADGKSIPTEFQKKECTVLGIIEPGDKAMIQLAEDENKCAIVPVGQLQGLAVTGDET